MPPLPRHRDAVLAGVMSIEGSGQAIQAVLIVLAKILGNVSREPAEMKYRTLKFSTGSGRAPGTVPGTVLWATPSTTPGTTAWAT